MIPKILHQTWKTEQVPEAFLAFRDSWLEHHPDWRYQLWTDVENRALVALYYPWFLRQYDSYPWPIQRVDAARYFMLHRYGGLYADLDFEALKPLDPLLDGKSCVLGLEAKDNADVFQRSRTICNALMASTPRHPFITHVMEGLTGYAERVAPDDPQVVLETTGPFMLTNAYDTFADQDAVHLAPSELLYPLSTEEADSLRSGAEPALSERLTDAYAVHYHHGTWWRGL